MTIDPVFARNPHEAERLAGKHILIVGLGSGGSALALMAARAGVGRLTLVLGAADFTTPDLVAGISESVSEVHTMPGVGHFPFYESESEFQALLTRAIP